MSKFILKLPEIGKLSSTEAQFIKHQRDRRVEKSHVRSEYGESFIRKSRLTKHQRIHLGERPPWMQHTWEGIYHKVQAHRTPENPYREKPYVYAKCGKAFLIESRLILPQKTQTGEKPSICRLWKWFHPEGQFHCTLEQSIGDEKR